MYFLLRLWFNLLFWVGWKWEHCHYALQRNQYPISLVINSATKVATICATTTHTYSRHDTPLFLYPLPVLTGYTTEHHSIRNRFLFLCTHRIIIIPLRTGTIWNFFVSLFWARKHFRFLSNTHEHTYIPLQRVCRVPPIVWKQQLAMAKVFFSSRPRPTRHNVSGCGVNGKPSITSAPQQQWWLLGLIVWRLVW